MSEEKLLTVVEFNNRVSDWATKVRLSSLRILQKTKASGKLSEELKSRFLRDKEGGQAFVGVGFRFWKYGAYREYGAGRGYIVKDGVIMKGHSSWYNVEERNKLIKRGYSEYRIRRMRTIDEHYAEIKRTPLPWLDPPIEKNIDDLADLSAEFYGDEALRAVLEDFRKMMIDKNYGKK